MYVGQDNKEVTFNEAMLIVNMLGMPRIIDKDLSTPPGAPSDGDAYIVATGGAGLWSGHDGKYAAWFDEAGEWLFLDPESGWHSWVVDEKRPYRHTGTGWVPAYGYDAYSAADTITASTTQTQAGGTVITVQCARLTTVANTGDSVTLEQKAVVGAYQEFLNAGANAAWIWPAVGDAIDAAAVDARDANALAAAGVRRYRCFTAGVWRTV